MRIIALYVEVSANSAKKHILKVCLRVGHGSIFPRPNPIQSMNHWY